MRKFILLPLFIISVACSTPQEPSYELCDTANCGDNVNIIVE